MKALDPSEILVCRVVSAHLTAAVRRTDCNSGRSVHDFEIDHADGRVAALEVTADADEAGAQWTRLNEPLLVLPACTRGWRVHLAAAPSKPDKWARSELTPFLLKLESQGVSEHTVYPDSASNEEVPASLRVLGYVCAEVDSTTEDGSARITISGWSAGQPDLLSDWAEQFTRSDRCRGEREKLIATGLNDRHLAVVIPFSPGSRVHAAPPRQRRDAFAALLAIADAGPPATIPLLPPEITHLWLISDYPGVRSLYLAPDRRWQLTEPAHAVITGG